VSIIPKRLLYLAALDAGLKHGSTEAAQRPAHVDYKPKSHTRPIFSAAKEMPTYGCEPTDVRTVISEQ